MPDTSSATKKPSKVVSVAPFGIEADNPRNCDILIKGIENTRLRSAVKATKMVFTREEGEQVEVPAPGQMLRGLPGNIPGMQLHVNPADRTWKVVDPLHDDPATCDRITRAIREEKAVTGNSRLKGVPPKSGKMDVDEIKTLVREMVQLVDAGEARVIRGSKPEMEDVDDLPGDYLLNPMKITEWNQPRYEKDLETWKRKMDKLPD